MAADAGAPPRSADQRHRSAKRVAGIDLLRTLLIAGVIVAHAAMTYGATGTWVYEEDSLSDPGKSALGALVGFGAMFGLGLFFLMSGWLAAGPLRRHGPGRYLQDRTLRLAVPLLAYVIVVWPVLQWMVDRVHGDHASITSSYRRRFAVARLSSLGSGPLWFVAVLLVVTVAALTARRVVEAVPPRHRGVTAGAGISWSEIAAAMTAVSVLTFLVRTRFPLDTGQFLDLHVWLWPQAFVLYVIGLTAAMRDNHLELTRTTRLRCLWSIAAAVLVLTVSIAASDGPDPFEGGWHWEAASLAAFEGPFSVAMSLLVFDGFRRRPIRRRLLIGNLARRSYAAFVVQGPVLVLWALAMRHWDAPGEIKFAILAATSVTACFGIGAVAVDLPRRWRSARSTSKRPTGER